MVGKGGASCTNTMICWNFFSDIASRKKTLHHATKECLLHHNVKDVSFWWCKGSGLNHE
jgi:hypothetical protein